MNMTYQQVKAAWYAESFDLVNASQKQITQLENEFIRTGDQHGADWVQSRYDDFLEEMNILHQEACLEFG
jgi:cytochrome c peroxidase